MKFNIPNALSFYRLLTFPLVMWLIVAGNEKLFVIFFTINLITDILDGLIARMFNMETEFGAKLDSLADSGMYVAAISGLFVFKLDVIKNDVYFLIVFIVLFVVAHVYARYKFKAGMSLHLYSSKIGGYLQGTFFFLLFNWKYIRAFYFFAVGWGILSYVEIMIVIYLLKEMRSDSKGLYWLLKGKKSAGK